VVHAASFTLRCTAGNQPKNTMPMGDSDYAADALQQLLIGQQHTGNT